MNQFERPRTALALAGLFRQPPGAAFALKACPQRVFRSQGDSRVDEGLLLVCRVELGKNVNHQVPWFHLSTTNNNISLIYKLINIFYKKLIFFHKFVVKHLQKG
jgi:hypothetical protein